MNSLDLVREQRDRLLLACQRALSAFDRANTDGTSTWCGADVDAMRTAVAACEIEAEKVDRRVGLSAKPKFLHQEMDCVIVAVHPSGFGGQFSSDGILLLEGRFGVRFLAPAEEWIWPKT